MADRTPEEMAAEIERLTQDNEALKTERDGLKRQVQSLTDKARARGSDPAVQALQAENLALKNDLAEVKGQVAAEKGPEKGTPICYQRGTDTFHRPGVVKSDGFTARVPIPGGMFSLHALIEVGEPAWIQHEHPKTGEMVTPKHTFEMDRAYNPLGLPDTWHMPDECPYAGQEGKCPYPDAQTVANKSLASHEAS